MLSPVYLAYLMDVKSCQVSISDKRFFVNALKGRRLLGVSCAEVN